MSLPSLQAAQMIELNFMKIKKYSAECLQIEVFKVVSYSCIY